MKSSEVKLICPYQTYVKCGDGIVRLVPCGKCYVCRSRNQNSWYVRLKEEMKVATSCYFVTLTYSDDNIPRDENGVPVVSSRDVQLFFKRLRSKLPKGQKIKYFLCSEYGPQTFRPHYHFILFDFPPEFGVLECIEKSWPNGFVTVSSPSFPLFA